MKATVYGQFVAGEDLFTIKPYIAKLKNSGVRSILDYAVEEDVANTKEDERFTNRLALKQMANNWMGVLHNYIDHCEYVIRNV